MFSKARWRGAYERDRPNTGEVTDRLEQVEEKIWLVSSTRYDLGFFGHETCRIEIAVNPLYPMQVRYQAAPRSDSIEFDGTVQ